jgi:hypothetical protein
MNKLFFLVILSILLSTSIFCTTYNERRNEEFPFLSVSENGHYLCKEGKPFFWLGDTGWLLFTQSPEDIDIYLQNRLRQEFNTLQIMVTSRPFDHQEFRKNYLGEVPFNNLDPPEFNEKYFVYIDDIVRKAAKYNLNIVLFPAWGTYLDQIFSIDKPENAFKFGFFLGNRYKKFKNVIWSVCGEYHKIAWDTEPKKPDSEPDEKELTLINNLARGLYEGHGGTQLMTIHPDGWKSSSEHFHNANWLDFNMIQSWSIGRGNEMDTRKDYFRNPAKPTLLAEPGYEFGGAGHQAFLVRYEGYHSVLNGGLGYTYGCEGIWNFKENWKGLLNSEGASQMIYLRKLFESRPFYKRLPAPDLIADPPGDWATGLKAMAGIANDSTWAVVYFPSDTSRHKIKAGKIKDNTVVAWWYNPRDGKCYTAENEITEKPFIEITGNPDMVKEFNPPGSHGIKYDWILVLDDKDARYAKP